MEKPTTSTILLRFIIKSENDEVQSQASDIRSALQAITPVKEFKIEPYWKLPKHFEISCFLAPSPIARDLFNELIHLAPAGWTLFGDQADQSAVWNPCGPEMLIHPSVRWAEFQLTIRE